MLCLSVGSSMDGLIEDRLMETLEDSVGSSDARVVGPGNSPVGSIQIDTLGKSEDDKRINLVVEELENSACIAVGSWNGTRLTKLPGVLDGDELLAAVGTPDGTMICPWLGSSDGEVLSTFVGIADGVLLSRCDGVSDGNMLSSLISAADGDMLSTFVGASERCMLSILVGVFDGRRLGNCDCVPEESELGDSDEPCGGDASVVGA